MTNKLTIFISAHQSDDVLVFMLIFIQLSEVAGMPKIVKKINKFRGKKNKFSPVISAGATAILERMESTSISQHDL